MAEAPKQQQAVPQEQLPQTLQDKMTPGKPGDYLLAAAMNPPEPPNYLQLIQPQQLPQDQVDKLLDNYTSHLMRMRSFRRQFDLIRAQWYRQYVMNRDRTMFPDNITPRSNTFVPYPLSNVETVVSRTLDAYFGFDPWFEVRGAGAHDDNAADAMEAVLHKKLRLAKFPSAFEELVRNIAMYGHAGIKVDWDWDYDIVTSAEPIIAQMPGPMGQMVPVPNPLQPGQPIILGYRPITKKVPRNRPKFIPIDIFDLLIDPDKRIIAHMSERTIGQMLREQETNPTLYRPEGLQALMDSINKEKEPEKVIVRIAEVWDEINNTVTVMTFNQDYEVLSLKDQRFAVRSGAAFSSYKRKAYGGKPILLYHGDNPFIHRRAPIVHTSYIKLPNEIYGIGAIECISGLTEALNKMVNQVSDNWNLGINKRYAYDLQAEIDHSTLANLNVPGGKVGVVGDPSKVIMPLPFFTPEPGDYTLLDLYKGMIELSSGVSDFYSKGMGSPAGNHTATGINQIVGESNFRFRLFIRNLEFDIIQPILEMCAMMVQQYIRDQEEILITEAPPGVPKYYQVQPEQLIGAFQFDIVAANYAENENVRQANVLRFSELVGESPFINQYEAIKQLAKVFKIRHIDSLLKTPEQVAAEEAAAQRQQVQMLILQSALEAETKSKIAQAKPGPGQGAGGGRPKSAAPHASGAQGFTSAVRSFAQSVGANSMGTNKGG